MRPQTSAQTDLMTVSKMLFLASLALATTACVTSNGVQSCGGEDDIRETAFRYMFSHNASAAQQSAEVYFLSLAEDRDPDAGFLARFAGSQRPVKPVSKSSISIVHGVRDRDTGATGLIFRVEEVRRIDGSTATAEGGYFEGSLSSSGNSYMLECSGGQWMVSDETLKWIS